MLDFLFGQYREYATLFIVLEMIAVVCGTASVWLARTGKVLAYPIGLISTSIFVYLLWEWQLFGDMLINAYYTIVSLYGWANWSKHSYDNTISIEKMQKGDITIASFLALFSFIFVGLVYYFKPFINNKFSMEGVVLSLANFVWTDWVDILTTGLFLVAMWLMANRKIEHWLFWIVADAISVPLYFYKGLSFTAIQYIVFTIIAVVAYVRWRAIWHSQN